MNSQDPMTPIGAPHEQTTLPRLVGFMSLFTLFMTFPQVWIIWSTRQAAGVSVVSWSAYLLSAFLWLFYGLQKRDKNIYLPCIGWILLDCGVIIGAVIYS